MQNALACAVVGDVRQVGQGMAAFAARHKPDEILLTANIYDHAARKRSFGLAMQAWQANA
ncbi:hypothetical protein D3C81_2241710 [compost metagenome]